MGRNTDRPREASLVAPLLGHRPWCHVRDSSPTGHRGLHFAEEVTRDASATVRRLRRRVTYVTPTSPSPNALSLAPFVLPRVPCRSRSPRPAGASESDRAHEAAPLRREAVQRLLRRSELELRLSSELPPNRSGLSTHRSADPGEPGPLRAAQGLTALTGTGTRAGTIGNGTTPRRWLPDSRGVRCSPPALSSSPRTSGARR